MGNNLFNISLSSLIITATYQRLINMDYADLAGSSEYQEMITKLERYISVEADYYSMLTSDDINNYFNLLKNVTSFNNQVDGRIYTRMNDIRRIRMNNPLVNDKVLLSSIISSKLTIDILKNVNAKIADLAKNKELDDTDVYMLELYHKRYKYHYLTSNSYIEDLSLKNNFDIEKLPSYTYYEVEREYGFEFVDNIQNNFYDYVMASLDELSGIQSNDKYLVSYISLFELARIEAVIPYLSLDSLNKLLLYIHQHMTKYDSNSALRRARKIIHKKKEEFNK